MNIEENDTVIDAAEKFLFKKVTTYSAYRLKQLGKKIQIDENLMEHIWVALKHCLSHMTNLLKNRHLDQIIICTIFGVCKNLNKMNFDLNIF
jgi:hypothetical protein